jgi:hypothetical protein
MDGLEVVTVDEEKAPTASDDDGAIDGDEDLDGAGPDFDERNAAITQEAFP